MNIDEHRRQSGRNGVRLVAAAVVLAGAGIAAWLLWQRQQPEPLALPVAAPVAAPAPVAEGPRFPLLEPAAGVAPPSLPDLNASDAAMLKELTAVAGKERVAELVWAEEIIRRLVVTIDNLPRAQMSARHNPLKPVKGQLLTEGKADTLGLSPKNAARYTPYVRAAAAVDTKLLVASYRSFYPLFQQAYTELGFGKAYFNDRLVEVIDHLLETPEVTGPVRLVVNHVLPEFADEALHARSAGQKMLIRAGAENTARIKAKLRDIRKALLEVSLPK